MKILHYTYKLPIPPHRQPVLSVFCISFQKYFKHIQANIHVFPLFIYIVPFYMHYSVSRAFFYLVQCILGICSLWVHRNLPFFVLKLSNSMDLIIYLASFLLMGIQIVPDTLLLPAMLQRRAAVHVWFCRWVRISVEYSWHGIPFGSTTWLYHDFCIQFPVHGHLSCLASSHELPSF